MRETKGPLLYLTWFVYRKIQFKKYLQIEPSVIYFASDPALRDS